MTFSSTTLITSSIIVISFCCFQFVLVIALNPSDKSADGVTSWNEPSEENDANAYVQSVQNFWTDARLAGDVPMPMPNNMNIDNNAKSIESGGEIKKNEKEKEKENYFILIGKY